MTLKVCYHITVCTSKQTFLPLFKQGTAEHTSKHPHTSSYDMYRNQPSQSMFCPRRLTFLELVKDIKTKR